MIQTTRSRRHAPIKGGEVVGRGNDAILSRDLGDGDQHKRRNTANAPVMQALGRKGKPLRKNLRSDSVDKRIVGMSFGHPNGLHGVLMKDNPEMLISKHNRNLLIEAMKQEVAARIVQRLKQIPMSQAALAKVAGISPQRLGNYLQGRTPPDLASLVAIAKTLDTSTDWILGLSEAGPPELEPILVRLLELEKMPLERAQVIAAACREALQIQRALQGDGDPLLRARMAAQAAWQSKLGPKPS